MAGYGSALAALLQELGYSPEDSAGDAPPLHADALDALFSLPSVRVQAFLSWFLEAARPPQSVKRQLRGAGEYALFLALSRGECGGLLSEEELALEETADQQQQGESESLGVLQRRREALERQVDTLERRLRLAEDKNARLATLVHKQATRSDANAQAGDRQRRAQETAATSNCISVQPVMKDIGREIDALVQHLGHESDSDASADKQPQSMRPLVYQQSLSTLLGTERESLERVNADVPRILAAMKKREEEARPLDSEERRTAWFFHDVDPQQLQLQEQDVYVYNRCCVELARLEKAFVSSQVDALMAQLQLSRASERHKQVKEARHRLYQQYELMSIDAVAAQRSTLQAALEATRKQLAEYQTRLLPRAFEEMAFLKTTSVLVGSYEQKLWRQERRFLQLRELVDALDLQNGRLRLTHRLLDDEFAELQHVERTLGGLCTGLTAVNTRAQARLQALACSSSTPLDPWPSSLPTPQLLRSSIRDADEVAHEVFTRLEHLTSHKSREPSETDNRSASSTRFRTFDEAVRLAERAANDEAKRRDDKRTMAVEWQRVFSDKRSALDALRRQLFGDEASATPLLVPTRLSTAVSEAVEAKNKAEEGIHGAAESLRVKKRALAMDPSVRNQQQAEKERLRAALASR